jgi:hypothetical protein
MKKLFAILTLISALTCLAQETPTDIKLKNGFVMKDCTILLWHPEGVRVKYVGGIVPVRFKDMDPADRARIEPHKETALKQQLGVEYLPVDLKLANGTVMKGCTAVRWHNDWVQVKYVGGVVPVAFKDMAPADRAKAEAYKANALAKQQAADEAKAQAIRAEKERQAPQREAEARKKAELARQKEAIKQGLVDGEVVVGMTRDQVRQVYGTPMAYSTITDANASEWWVYPGLGTNEDGTPCNLKIHFDANRVARWNNTQHTAAGYQDWNND